MRTGTTKKYLITPTTGESFTVRAGTHVEAARIATQRLYGTRAICRRISGTKGAHPGDFMAFKNATNGPGSQDLGSFRVE